MKKKGIAGSSIFVMWERASKTIKTDEMSTPNQTAVLFYSYIASVVRFNSYTTIRAKKKIGGIPRLQFLAPPLE